MAESHKKWEVFARDYRRYIRLEKHLSENTVDAYMRDLEEFAHYIMRWFDVPPERVEQPMIERYMAMQCSVLLKLVIHLIAFIPPPTYLIYHPT